MKLQNRVAISLGDKTRKASAIMVAVLKLYFTNKSSNVVPMSFSSCVNMRKLSM